MRQIEGNEIKLDIQKRVELIEDLILKTEQLTKNFSKLKISKIKNKILELVDDIFHRRIKNSAGGRNSSRKI